MTLPGPSNDTLDWEAKLERAGIVRLEVPMFFGLKTVNIYVCLGPPPVLIDSGLFKPPVLNGLRQALNGIGVRPEDIAHVFLTHAHSDHAGGVMALANQCGTKIWAHPLEAPRLDGRHYRFLNDTLPGLLHRLGADNQTAQDMQTSLKEPLQVYRRQVLDNFMPLPHGLRLPVQGLDLQVIHTPGHTQGSVCFFDKRHGLLFAGDTLLPSGPAQATMAPGDDGLPFLEGQIGLEKSLTKLSSLEVEVVLGGHGPPASLDALVSMTGKGYAALRASVLEALSAGLTPYELTRRKSRARDSFGLYMELGHIRAVLEALLADDLVRLEIKDGLERFSPA